jgi:hypothetical protein
MQFARGDPGLSQSLGQLVPELLSDSWRQLSPLPKGFRVKGQLKGLEADPHRLLAVRQPGIGDAVQLQVVHQIHPFSCRRGGSPARSLERSLGGSGSRRRMPDESMA